MSNFRPSGRALNELRDITITHHFTAHAEGSVLIAFGQTKVICNASVEDRVPGWLRGKSAGWVSAEYGMLPRSTHSRMRRETHNGPSGRTMEIQRLIGRSMRACIDLKALGERTVQLDCDVLQADGGTRTASITGAYVALRLAMDKLVANGKLSVNPVIGQISAVSVGIYNGEAVVDLDYAEDSQAETDMNVVMNEAGGFIEVQGTAEGTPFLRKELDQLLDYAAPACQTLFEAQRAALA